MKKRNTGIDAFDKKFGGGLPQDGLVTIQTQSETQGELFFYYISNQHETRYITTMKDEFSIKDNYEKYNLEIPTITEQFSDYDEIPESIGESECVIIDNIGMIKEEIDDYSGFLNRLNKYAKETNTLIIVHQFHNTEMQLTTSFSDVFIQIKFQIEDTKIRIRMYVPKYRGESPPDEIQTLQFKKSDITIDTSRNIA